MIAHFTHAVVALFKFLAQLALGILAAVLYTLPWLLRGLSVVIWLVSAFVAIQTVSAIYSPFSDGLPVLALQFLVIILMVLWAMVGLMDHKDVWGLLAAGGAVMYGLAYGANMLMTTWQYAHLFFRVLPVTLLAVGMITISIRTRTRHMSHMGSAKLTPSSEVST